MDYAALAAIITAVGGGMIIPKLFTRAWDAISGRGKRRRDEVDRAWRRVDREAQRRRVVEEHASHLRRMLIDAPCVDVADIPPFPSYRSTDTNSIEKE